MPEFRCRGCFSAQRSVDSLRAGRRLGGPGLPDRVALGVPALVARSPADLEILLEDSVSHPAQRAATSRAWWSGRAA